MADMDMKTPWYKSSMGIAAITIILLLALGVYYWRERTEKQAIITEEAILGTIAQNYQYTLEIPMDEDGIVEPGREATLEGIKLYGEEKYESAKAFLEKAIEEGNSDAKALLGKMYVYGHGVAVDTKKGLDYLEDAAEKGSSYAMSELGILYVRGSHGVEHAADKGMALIKRAMEHGKYYGYLAMAELHKAGEGVERSAEKAVHYLEEAGKHGYRYAQEEIVKLKEKL